MAKLDVIETLVKALDESGGKTVDIVVEHTLPGITQDMYEWWGRNMGNTKYYKMWHPAHVSFTHETSADPNTPSIANPTEMLGEYGPSTMRFKGEPKNKYPFKPKYKNYRCATHLSPNNRALSMLCSEYEEGPDGLKLLEIFRWPAKTPKSLIDALRNHVNEEAGNFPKFLPELYKKETGKSK
ncbi:MAG: hypothetical protein A2144_02025 [Chloroflexi bacterium RBG_16_50_9]|nr:MAG: hypothetical protein A2144_02025 [Chloroflexi bacterium RBG_16_50_9]